MHRYLKSKGYKDIINNNLYLIAEGDLPVCLCAHLDTVFQFPPTTFYFDKDKTVLWSPDGLGADDRAGCFAIIELIERGYRPSIILTDMEEKGGIGASALIDRFPECPFLNCKALIQLDRQGERDAVYYDCDNEAFEELITSYGFISDWGTFTDISIIAPQWGIAAVNLSVGYFDEHMKIETLNMNYLYATIARVEKMLKNCENWDSYGYIPHIYTSQDAGFGIFNPLLNCAICGKELPPDGGHYCHATDNPTKDLKMCDACYKLYGINNMEN